MDRFWLSQGAHTAWDSGANLEILLIAGTFWKKFFFLCIDDPTNFSSFLVIFDYIFFSV
jgi:hypothetical protein